MGYISVIETLKVVTETTTTTTTTTTTEEKYRVVAPEAMHETFMSDSEEEGGMITKIYYKYFEYGKTKKRCLPYFYKFFTGTGLVIFIDRF